MVWESVDRSCAIALRFSLWSVMSSFARKMAESASICGTGSQIFIEANAGSQDKTPCKEFRSC